MDIGKAIGEGECEFLDGGCSRLANVIAADADGIPARHVARAKLDGIGDQAHGWLRWEKELLLSAVFLENIVLQCAAQLLLGEAALLGIDDIHGPDHGCRAINGHGSGYLVECQTIEKDLKIAQR